MMAVSRNKIVIDGNSLTIDQVVEVARNYAQVEVSTSAIDAMIKSRKIVEDIVNNRKIVYGVTTGFGKLRNKFIDPEKGNMLQENLVKSHSCGVGNYVDKEIIRAVMLIRANTLAKGFSGIRPEIINLLISMINKDIIPLVPEKGSVGASGDLVPLAHIALALMGSNKVIYKGKETSADKALETEGLKPMKPTYKEGIALINGTAFMMGYATLAYYDAKNLAKYADMAAALSLEALLGTSAAFNQKIMSARPIPGQIETAENILKLVAESKLVNSKKNKVQDAYSIRCVPQIHAPVKDTLKFVKKILDIELNSATDNPLIFHDGSVISGGNFHGEPISAAMDYLAIAMTILGNVSERRIARLIDDTANEGLPLFLIDKEKVGLNSGYMIPQYVAAALASENKVLAHPASVDSIPTSANFEDFVSMGPIAARKAYEIIKNTRRIIAIELLLGCQAIDFRGGSDMLGIGTKVIYDTIRKEVPMLRDDRILMHDILKVETLLKTSDLIRRVENIVGELK